MNTKVILEVDTLKNLVEWVGRNFVSGERPTNARTLYMFANKPGTLLDFDGCGVFSKFNSDSDAEQYLNAFANMKFIIESELADTTKWTYNRGTQNEYTKVTETWRITVTPSANNTEDAFNMYCPKPYNPE